MSEALSGDSVRRNAPADPLPVPMTPLLGRDREIEAVRAMLDVDNIRLVTLTGAGGIRKTRLVLDIVRTMAGDFAHGALFVPLASVPEAEFVPATVAHAFGIRSQGGAPVTETLTAALRDQHVLMLLDNLEHLVDGVAPWIAALLTACSRVHVLATSRVPLRIAGEQRYPVEPLALPERSSDRIHERISQSSAVQLFIQRARAARPDLALNAETTEDIAEICRLLDGVPLAIELAAAWVSILSMPELRNRLANRLTLLIGGQREVPLRHQTMRDAIAWSHELLPEPEQRAFRRLSVFVGGFTLDAAESVVALNDLEIPVIQVLAMLVDHSILQFVPRPP